MKRAPDMIIGGLERHLEKWWNGEDADPATGVPHLASVIACAGIVLDARLCGKLNDDRPPTAPISKLIDDAEALVKALMAMHADKAPHHCTQIEPSPKKAPR